MSFYSIASGVRTSINRGVAWATALLDWKKRIPLTINGLAKTADLTDTFATDNFTHTGTETSVSGGTFNMEITATSGSEIGHDLHTITDGTDFVVEFDFIATSADTGDRLAFGFAAGTGVLGEATQDALYFRIHESSGFILIGCHDRDGTTDNLTNGGNFVIPIATKTYWRFSRSDTHLILTVFADSDRTEVIDTITHKIVSIVTGLTHWQFGKDTSDATMVWTGVKIDNLKIYDGVTVVENIPSKQIADAVWGKNADQASEDFTTYANTTEGDTAWPTSDTTNVRVNPSTDVLDYSGKRDNTNDGASFDLGATTISDDKWVLRFKFNFTSWTAGSDASMMVVLSDLTHTTQNDGNQDSLGFLFGYNANTDWGLNDGAAAVPIAIGGTENNPSFQTATDYYVEITRLSTTLFQGKLFSDTGFKTQIGTTITQACSASVGGLRHLVVRNRTAANTGGGAIVATIDDIEFWDSVTEVNPATLTDYPIPIKIIGNTDLQRKTTETIDEDYNTDDWTHQNSDTSIDTTTEVLDFHMENPAGDDLYRGSSLGITALSDSKWVLHADIELTARTGGSGFGETFFGMSDLTVDQNTAQDWIGVNIFGSSGGMHTNAENGTTVTSYGGDATDAGMTNWVNRHYYLKLRRTSTTTYDAQLFVDSSYTIPMSILLKATCSASIVSLDTIKIMNLRDSGTGTGSSTGKIHSVKIWDGIVNPVNQEVETRNEDFTTDTNWTKEGTLFTIDTATDERLEATMDRSTTNHSERLDLETLIGSPIDTKFVCEYQLDILTYSGNTTDVDSHIGFSSVDGTGGAIGSAELGQQFILQFALHSSARNFNQVLVTNGTMNGSPTVLSPSEAVGTGTWYVRHIRDGDLFTTELYSDTDRSILLTSLTETLAGMDSLRYFRVQNHTVATAGGTGTFAVDDFNFWNGVTSPDASGRKFVFTDNIVDGSDTETQFSSKMENYDPINGDWIGEVRIPSLTAGADTTIQMYYNYLPTLNPDYEPERITDNDVFGLNDDQPTETFATYTTQGEANANWPTEDATNLDVIIADDVIKATVTSSVTANKAIGLTLPAALTGDFRFRCKFDQKVVTEVGSFSTNVAVGLGSSAIGGAKVFAGLRGRVQATTKAFFANIGTSVSPAADQLIEFATDPSVSIIFVEVKRVGSLVTVGIYSDSTFATLTEEETETFTDNTLDTVIVEILSSVSATSAYTVEVDDIEVLDGVFSNDKEKSTWDNNYKAVYNLQGNSLDSTIYKNDGTDTAVDHEQQNNSVGITTDALTTKIDAGSDVSIDDIFAGGGSLTVTFNAKSDGENNVGKILRKFDTAGQGWHLGVRSEASGLIRVHFQRDFATTDGQWETAVVIPINELHTLIVNYNENSLDNNPVFIINGIKYTVGNGLTESATPVGAVNTDAASKLIIANHEDQTETFDGFLNNGKLSDKSRPSSESITSYNAEKSDTDIITEGAQVSQ